MEILFTTVVRRAPVEHGGEFCVLDMNSKKIIKKKNIYPTNPSVIDPNPRGNSRGGRGVFLFKDKYYVSSYHSINVFNNDLELISTITNNQFAGIHEVLLNKQKAYISSTAINAGFVLDLCTEKIVKEYWPTDDNSIKDSLNSGDFDIDKSIDNRLNFLHLHNRDKKGHLHLNVISSNGIDTFGLFNKFGAICNLDKSTVIMKNYLLEGAHNLIFINTKIAYSLSTQHGYLLEINLDKKSVTKKINFNKLNFSKRILRKVSIHNFLNKFVKSKKKPGTPLFWRGLCVTDNKVYVGTSPASILIFDIETFEMIDFYQYNDNPRVAIHGLFCAERQ